MRTIVFVLFLLGSSLSLGALKSPQDHDIRHIGSYLERVVLELMTYLNEATRVRTPSEVPAWHTPIEKLLPELTHYGAFQEVNGLFIQLVRQEFNFILRFRELPASTERTLIFILEYLKDHGTLMHFESFKQAVAEGPYIQLPKFQRKIAPLIKATTDAMSSRLVPVEQISLYKIGRTLRHMRENVSDRKPEKCQILQLK